MFWYIIILSMMAYPWLVVSAGKISNRDSSRLALQISCGILWFFMAFRAITVGVDTKYYGYVFYQFSDIPFAEIFDAKLYAEPGAGWGFDFEPGYRLYNKILSCFSDSQQLITVCNSSMIIVLLYRWLRKESPNALLSIWLYITLGVYQTEMNVARNAIAIFIVYNSLHYIQEKQLLKYTTAVIVASLFHKSVFVFLPLYWIMGKLYLSEGKMFFTILAAAAIGINYSIIGPYLRAVLPAGLDRYFTVSNGKMETLIVGVLYAALILFLILFLKRQEKIKALNKYRISTWMFTLNMCFFGLNIGLGAAARMAALFGPYIILYVPELLECVSDQERKKKLTMLIVIGCGCQYIARLMLNNIGGTMPYRFFF